MSIFVPSSESTIACSFLESAGIISATHLSRTGYWGAGSRIAADLLLIVEGVAHSLLEGGSAARAELLINTARAIGILIGFQSPVQVLKSRNVGLYACPSQ